MLDSAHCERISRPRSHFEIDAHVQTQDHGSVSEYESFDSAEDTPAFGDRALALEIQLAENATKRESERAAAAEEVALLKTGKGAAEQRVLELERMMAARVAEFERETEERNEERAALVSEKTVAEEKLETLSKTRATYLDRINQLQVMYWPTHAHRKAHTCLELLVYA